MSDAAALLFDRPIAFQRVFVELGAGITGALMLSQAVYWQRRAADETGWFWKTVDEWKEETGLTRTEQENARAKLAKLGVLEIDRKGVPARLHFRVNTDRLQQVLEQILAGEFQTPPAIRSAGLPQSGAQVSSKQARSKDADKAPANPPTNIRKTTTETTTETTTDISSAGATPPAPALPDGVSMVLTAPNGATYEVPSSLHYPMPGRLTHATWAAYAVAYLNEYGSWPVWNASTAGQVSELIKRIGADAAPRVAVHYVRRVKEAFVVKKMHSFKLLVSDAEAYHTQWQSGRTMTGTQAQQADQTESNANAADDAADKAIAMLAARRAGGGNAD